MTHLIDIVLALSGLVTVLTLGWSMYLWRRSILIKKRALPGFVGSAYRSPDPAGDLQRTETYGELIARTARSMIRLGTAATWVFRCLQWALACGMLAAAGRSLYVRQIKKYPVEVTVINKLWMCRVGSAGPDGSIRADHWIEGRNWSWGRDTTASCPTAELNGTRRAQIAYYVLLEARSDSSIIRSGEHFVSVGIPPFIYQQMEIGTGTWVVTTNGLGLSDMRRSFHSSFAPLGGHWPQIRYSLADWEEAAPSSSRIHVRR